VEIVVCSTRHLDDLGYRKSPAFGPRIGAKKLLEGLPMTKNRASISPSKEVIKTDQSRDRCTPTLAWFRSAMKTE